jgi:type II secretory pathway component GspD/PulD (secretin)
VRAVALLAGLAIVAAPVAAADRVVREASAPVRVQLDSMPMGALVTLLMRDVLNVPYVISNDILGDSRATSVNLILPRPQLVEKTVEFLRSMGLVVQLRGGTVYVTKKPIAGAPDPSVASFGAVDPSIPSGSPLVGQRSTELSTVPAAGSNAVGPTFRPGGAVNTGMEVAIIEPAHRSPSELASTIAAIVPDLVIAVRDGSKPSGNAIVDQLEPDRLVIRGSLEQVDRALDLVRILDVARPVVAIRAVVFEVRVSKSRGSALSLLASALGGKVQLGSFSAEAPGSQFLRIATGGVKAALSAVSGDGRFQVVAEPSLSALSGSAATINSGSQVPTVGSITYTQDGVPIQSVAYRDSGVSLTVTPVARSGEIVMDVVQERSTFVRTTTGVDGSPTLNKSSSTARVAIAPGETVAIAGLDQRSDDASRDGLFGGLLGVRSHTKDSSQLLLLVQADIAVDGRKGTANVVRMAAGKAKRGVPAQSERSDDGGDASALPAAPAPSNMRGQ